METKDGKDFVLVIIWWGCWELNPGLLYARHVIYHHTTSLASNENGVNENGVERDKLGKEEADGGLRELVG